MRLNYLSTEAKQFFASVSLSRLGPKNLNEEREHAWNSQNKRPITVKGVPLVWQVYHAVIKAHVKDFTSHQILELNMIGTEIEEMATSIAEKIADDGKAFIEKTEEYSVFDIFQFIEPDARVERKSDDFAYDNLCFSLNLGQNVPEFLLRLGVFYHTRTSQAKEYSFAVDVAFVIQ